MKPQIVTRGIVLSRTNYQEADRIITVLTPDHGKVSLMVKGARRSKSKLAGGIELFSVSDITFLLGRKDVGTLISSRLKEHYAGIVKDIDRTMFGYEVLKKVHRITEDAAGQEYFDILNVTLASLGNHETRLELVEIWLNMQLLSISGHGPNLRLSAGEVPLAAEGRFSFDFDQMSFAEKSDGPYSANDIKLLRLGTNVKSPQELLKLRGADKHIKTVLRISQDMLQMQLSV